MPEPALSARGDAVGLDRLFRPRAVAVIGASHRAGSVGGAVLHNLLRGGFQGPVYPVNRHAPFVQSVRAYPDLASLPEVPDLAVIVVPAPEVPSLLREGARLGVPAVCVISAGFGETPAGRDLETEITTIARGAAMRLLGPNCLGLQNPDPTVRLDATFATTFAPDGHVAFATQSGALGLAALDYAQDLGIGFSLFASLGNKADVSGNDVLEQVARDERTRLVLLYLESLGNGRRFREIAVRLGRHKPIALVKSGRSKAGARAAGSHTGALAGPDSAISALCRQTGVLRADTLEELFDVAMVLANQPLPTGRRVAIVTNAGGPGILAADALEGAGLEVPRLDPATERSLRAVLREAASVQNPVDVLADAGARSFGEALRLVRADPGIDAALAVFVPPITTQAQEVAAAILEVAGGAQKPILSCFMGTHGVPESLRSLHAGRVPSFRFPEGAARALALVTRHAEWRRTEAVVPAATPAAPERAQAALRSARRRLGAEGGWLSGEEATEFCAAFGMALAPAMTVAPDPDAAAAAAEAIGFPVVLKALRGDLLHKSQAGGVELGLANGAAVRAAVSRLAHLGPSGLLVQRQLTGGEEWLVGAVRDPDLGPLVTVGAGGTRTEIWKDVEQRLAPLSDADLDALVGLPRFARTLEGSSGRPAGDRAALRDFVRRLAYAADALSELEEIESNPLLVFPEGLGAAAVDVRIRIGRSAAEPEAHASRRL